MIPRPALERLIAEWRKRAATYFAADDAARCADELAAILRETPGEAERPTCAECGGAFSFDRMGVKLFDGRHVHYRGCLDATIQEWPWDGHAYRCILCRKQRTDRHAPSCPLAAAPPPSDAPPPTEERER